METERAFVGCALLQDDNLTEQHYEMPPRFLTDPQLSGIWEVVVKLHNKKQQIDLVTVAREVKKEKRLTDEVAKEWAVDIAELMNDVPVHNDINAYYRIIFEDYKIARIKKAKSTKEVTKLLEQSKKYEITEEDTSSIFESLSKTTIKDSLIIDNNPFTWTVDIIDKTMGRPVPGVFYVIVGESGVGKSIISADISLANSDHANVAFFSLEMEKADFLQDYVLTKIGKTRDEVIDGKISPLDRIKAAKIEKNLNESPVAFIDDTGLADAGISINVNEIIKLCDDNAVTMVFIDSLSKLRASSEKSHVDEARATDALAKWRNRRMEEGNPITIFLIHHLGKDNTTAAGSMKIEHDCGGMVILTNESKEDGTILWQTGKIRKNRYCKRTLKRHEGGLIDDPWQ